MHKHIKSERAVPKVNKQKISELNYFSATFALFFQALLWTVSMLTSLGVNLSLSMAKFDTGDFQADSAF